MSDKPYLGQFTLPKDYKLKGKAKCDSRICFAIDYFTDESDANTAAAEVKRRGDTYNGGLYDGMPCGREAAKDHIDKDGVVWYAVTH